jgi:cyclophilin family peptidyl-prolyl cis-trans isomerase
MIQFGIHGDPAVSRAWASSKLADDPPKESNKKGYVTYANAGPGTRGTQLFINLVDNSFLDAPQMAFTPFGRVVSGMDVVEKINTEHGIPRHAATDRIHSGRHKGNVLRRTSQARLRQEGHDRPWAPMSSSRRDFGPHRRPLPERRHGEVIPREIRA